jgi:hypothetical protein
LTVAFVFTGHPLFIADYLLEHKTQRWVTGFKLLFASVCFKCTLLNVSGYLYVLCVVVRSMLNINCNSLTVSMLLLPLLQLHSMVLQSWTKHEKVLVGTVLDAVIQHVHADSFTPEAASTCSVVSPATESYACLVYEQLAVTLSHSDPEKWLKHAKIALSSCSAPVQLPRLLTCLVAALFVRCKDLTGIQQSIAVLRQVCAKDSNQVRSYGFLLRKSCHDASSSTTESKANKSV